MTKSKTTTYIFHPTIHQHCDSLQEALTAPVRKGHIAIAPPTQCNAPTSAERVNTRMYVCFFYDANQGLYTLCLEAHEIQLKPDHRRHPAKSPLSHTRSLCQFTKQKIHTHTYEYIHMYAPMTNLDILTRVHQFQHIFSLLPSSVIHYQSSDTLSLCLSICVSQLSCKVFTGHVISPKILWMRSQYVTLFGLEFFFVKTFLRNSSWMSQICKKDQMGGSWRKVRACVVCMVFTGWCELNNVAQFTSFKRGLTIVIGA